MSEPLLSVSGLAKRFYRGGRIVPAVDGISLHIDRGEILALAGRPAAASRRSQDSSCG